ncbi:MAG: cvpA [Rickettsiales bacterium]|jgi:uncharacterized membrane protein required for colicin V production|nr:cvpA [Rickettsiales bacterium]
MDFTALNTFDIIIIFIVLLSTLIAFFKGFIHSLLSFVVWFGAGTLSYLAMPYVEPLVANYSSNTVVIKTVTIFGSYVTLLILLGLASIPISNLASPITKGVVDRSLGLIFGLARGVAFVLVIFMSIILSYSMMTGVQQGPLGKSFEEHATAQEKSENAAKSKDDGLGFLKNAQTYLLLERGTEAALSLLPEKTYKEFTTSFEKSIRAKAKDLAGSPEKLQAEEPGALFEKTPDEASENGDVLQKKSWIEGQLGGMDNSNKEAGYRPDQIHEIERLMEQVSPKH